MRVLFLDTKPFNPNRYIARGVFDALHAAAGVRECVWAEYRSVAELATRGRFDLFLAFGGEEADNAAVHKAARLAAKSAIWFTEDPYEAVRNRALAEHFDLAFSNDAGSATFYGHRGRHLPLAADPARNYFPVTDAPRPFDIFFAGTAWPNRLIFLDELRQRRPQLRYRTLLVSNAALAPHVARFARQLTFSAGVPIREFCRLASLSQLTLTLPRKFATGGLREDAASDTPGPRFFEVALAGSCQLVDAQTTPVAATALTEGTEFVGFREIDDCVAAIDTLLADPDRILSIARAAQHRVLREHTYAQRVQALLGEVQDTPRRVAVAWKPTAPNVAVARPHVLIVTHNVSAFGGFGGAEVYVDRLRTHVTECELSILTPDRRSTNAGRYVLLDRALNEIDAFEVDVPYAEPLLIHPPIEHAFERLLVKHGIDIVHFNHLLSYPPSLPLHAKAMGCATLFTQHDHFLQCDSFTLTDASGTYCRIDRRALSACDGCLAQAKGIVPGSQSRRLRYLRQVLGAVDRILVGSDAGRALLLRFYPEVAARCVTVTPPMEMPSRTPRPAPVEPAQPLRVVHLGNFTRFKGAETVLQVIERCAELPAGQIEFHIHGRVDAEYAPRLRQLDPALVQVHGGYASGALPAAVAQADVLLFLSTWPETYGITLSEGQAAGLVPIVTSLGAPAERVRDGVDGFVVDPADVDAVAGRLRELATDRRRLEQLRSHLPEHAGVSAADFAAQVQALYRSLATPQLLAADAAAAADESPRRTLTFEELGLFLTQPTWTQTDMDPAHRRSLAAMLPGGRRQLRFFVRRFVEVQRTQGLRTALAMARRRIGIALHAGR
jgi:glycosyltransferase involved in cell wall biosynthesis